MIEYKKEAAEVEEKGEDKWPPRNFSADVPVIIM